VINPIETYRHWFNETRFKVISEIPIIEKVEDFFLHPSIVNERLKKQFENPHTMRNQLEISFVEYVLESDQQVF
jgi:hypothetical protein